MNIFRTKSVEQSIRDTEESEHKLKKELGLLDLIVFGIGVIIGTGIFVLTGVAAATKAGPAIALSFVVAGIVTTIKLCVVVFFILFGIFFIKFANWSPFIPPAVSISSGGGAGDVWGVPLLQLILGLKQQAFGWPGIITGAATVFFAYIGFDIVATTAEETRKPQRDMPIGIIGSLSICTVLYIMVSLVMTGVVSCKKLDNAAPMATAFSAIGQPWAAALVSLGAICGLTAVIMILMLGQSRVFFAMSRDRLLPGWFATVHPRFGTPYRISIITGIVVALIAAFTPIDAVADLVNIGTLLAFVLVSIGVVILRRTQPNLRRAFRTPFVPVLPILAVLICLYLMLSLPLITWVRFIVWLVIGIIVYFVYGVHHSRLATGAPQVGKEAERDVVA